LCFVRCILFEGKDEGRLKAKALLLALSLKAGADMTGWKKGVLRRDWRLLIRSFAIPRRRLVSYKTCISLVKVPLLVLRPLTESPFELSPGHSV
jgi:hypothetical protein